MRARTWAMTAMAGLTMALLPAVGNLLTPANAVGGLTMAVTGSSWFCPAFDPDVRRYAVHPADDGTIHVDMTGSEQVWFNGVPDADGSADFTDVQPGDEISVFTDDGAGNRRAFALYVLPARFPRLSATSAEGQQAQGNLAFTLDRALLRGSRRSSTGGASPYTSTRQPKAYISYRAALVPERDGFDPEVTLDGPVDGVSVPQGAEVPVTFSCEDRGGSTLQTCVGPAGRRLDTTTPGNHTWQVVARDGSGRQTTRTRTYTVVAPTPTVATVPPTPPVATVPPTPPGPTVPAKLTGPRPDLAVRPARGSWVGSRVYSPTRQVARVDLPRAPGTRVVVLRLTNRGETRGRLRLRGSDTAASGAVVVRYRSRGKVRTRAVSRGWRTPVLEPGQSVRVRAQITAVRPSADRWTLALRSSGGGLRDRVLVAPRG